jgi:hypothetical protein
VKTFDDGSDWLFKIVPWFIGFVFVLVIAAFVGYGVLAYKGAKALQNCTPAIVHESKDGKDITTIGCKP